MPLLLTTFGSVAIAGWLAVFVPITLAAAGLRLDSNWLWLAPGWGLLKPGRDDGALNFWSVVITTPLYSLVIFPLLHLLIKRIGAPEHKRDAGAGRCSPYAHVRCSFTNA